MAKLLSAIFFVSLINYSLASTTLPFYIVSDTSNWVEGPSLSTGKFSVVTTTDSDWTASIPGASWIWETSGSSSVGVTKFYKYFFIAGTPTSSSLEIAADATFTTFLNGELIGCNDSTGNTYNTALTCTPATSLFVSGVNVFHIEVTSTSTNNCGLLYKLYVVSNYT
jgi:hypothetical protein